MLPKTYIGMLFFCWNITYGSVFVPVLFTTVTDFLYLGCGLNYIPYGLHSCRSLSFIILLQVMIPRLRCCKTIGQRTQYIDSRDLFVEVRDKSTDADSPARRQPSAIRVETRRCYVYDRKDRPRGFRATLSKNEHHPHVEELFTRENNRCSARGGEGEFNPNTSVNPFPSTNPRAHRSCQENLPTANIPTIATIDDRA